MKILNALDLKGGAKAELGGINTTLTQPIQFLPRKEKDDKWVAWVADWLEWNGIRQISRNARKILKNYKLAKGIIDRTDYIPDSDNDYREVIDTLQVENIAALELKFYPIIPNVINVMCAEFAKRNTSVSFQSVDDESYNTMLEEKRQQVESVLVQRAQQKLMMKLIEQGIDPEDPEMQEQVQQELSEDKIKGLPEIEKFFSKNYRSMGEQWASHQYKVDAERFRIDELEERGFRDMLITDREFWHFKMLEDDYDVELWNPALVFYYKSPEVRYVSDGAWVGKIDLMTISDVIDKYGWLLTEEQQKAIEAIYPVKSAIYPVAGYQNDGSFYDATKSHDWNVNRPSLEWRQFMSTWEGGLYGPDVVEAVVSQSESTFDWSMASLIRVTTSYWKSQRKVGHLTKIDEVGNVIIDIVSEEYVVHDKPVYNTAVFKNKTRDNLVFGEHIDWIWINETWGVTKIGPNRPSMLGMSNPGGVNPMYIGINQNKPGPLKFQFKGDKTLYGCKLPVEGAIFSDRNTKSMSLVDLMKPFQVSYNMVNNQIADILVDELGTVILLDQNVLPKHSLGEDWGKNNYAKAYTAMKDFSILPVDTSLTNTENGVNFNHFQVLPLEQTQRLMSRIQLANYFKQQAYEVIGITPQRLGQQIGQTQTATGVEQAISASYAQTEMYFIQHSDYLMPRVHQMRTDLAQYYHSTNPSLRLQYMTTLDEKVNFEINGTQLLLSDINVYCTTKADYRSLVEQLKQLAVNNNTTGASLYDLGNIMQSKSLAEIDHVMKDMEKKAMQQKQQEQQQQQQLEQMRIEAAEKDRKLQMDHQAMENEKNRRKDILIAEIRAAGMGAMVDINKNMQSDYLDEMERIRNSEEFQDTMSLQREKETNRQTNEREMQMMEREKLNTQLQMKNMDLQIAQENKNKYDVENLAKSQNQKKQEKKKKG